MFTITIWFGKDDTVHVINKLLIIHTPIIAVSGKDSFVPIMVTSWYKARHILIYSNQSHEVQLVVQSWNIMIVENMLCLELCLFKISTLLLNILSILIHGLITISTDPAGEPSLSPIFPRGFTGEFQGITPAEISAWFPRGNEGEMKGNFLRGYFRLLSLWNPWEYFHVEISLVLPSKIWKWNLVA